MLCDRCIQANVGSSRRYVLHGVLSDKAVSELHRHDEQMKSRTPGCWGPCMYHPMIALGRACIRRMRQSGHQVSDDSKRPICHIWSSSDTFSQKAASEFCHSQCTCMLTGVAERRILTSGLFQSDSASFSTSMSSTFHANRRLTHMQESGDHPSIALAQQNL